MYSVPAGNLPADGRNHHLTVNLPATAQAHYPLRTLALSLSYRLPGFPPPPYPDHTAQAAAQQVELREAARHVTLVIRWLALSAREAGRFAAPFAPGRALTRWQAAATSPELADPHASGASPKAASPRAEGDATSVTFAVGAGHLIEQAGQPPLPISGKLALTAAGPPVPVPAIATSGFLAAANAHLGEVIPLQMADTTVLVRLVAQIRAYPSAGPAGPALIVDQSWLQGVLARRASPPLPVNQWWLRTADGPPAGLPAGASVASLAASRAELLNDPLPNVPQLGLLVIVVAAALLAAVGLLVSVAATVRERRPQQALLAALGVSRAARAGQLYLEQLGLSVSGSAVGALIGVVLAHLLVPVVTLTTAANVPFPPVRVVVPLGWLGLLVLAVAVVPVLTAAIAAAHGPDPGGQLRAGETA